MSTSLSQTWQHWPVDLDAALDQAPSHCPVPDIADRTFWRSVDGDLPQAPARWPQPLASQWAAFARRGDRDAWQAPLAHLRDGVTDAVLRACRTDQEDDLLNAIDGLDLVRRLPSWCLPAHEDRSNALGWAVADDRHYEVDLWAGEVAAQLAWSLYLLRPRLEQLMPGFAGVLTGSIRERVLEPFLKRTDWRWLVQFTNNWNPWIHHNVITAAVLAGTTRSRRLVVARALVGLDAYLDSLPEDGSIEEGPGYFWHGAVQYAEAVRVLQWATGGEFKTLPCAKLNAVVRFPMLMNLGPGWTWNFSDASARVETAGGAESLFWWAGQVNEPQVQAFARHLDAAHSTEQPIERLLYRLIDREWQSRPPDGPTYPRSAVLPDGELALFRQSQRGATGLTAGMKGGHNDASHNHNDIGSVILALDGEPLLIDVGAPTYTRQTFSDQRYQIWAMQSGWHNVPVINGEQQAAGREFEAGNFQADSDAQWAELDLGGAYPSRPQWRRRIQLDAGGVTLHESFDPQQVNSAELTFILRGDVRLAPGQVLVALPGQEGTQTKLTLTWQPDQAEGQLEVRTVDDPRLALWGGSITRLRLRLLPTALRAAQFVLHGARA